MCLGMIGTCVCLLVFIFFKQKTAYELLISDWSSDVCSSDLAVGDVGARDAGGEFGPERDRIAAAILERVHLLRDDIGGLTERAREHGRRLEHRDFEALEAIEPPHAIEHIGDAREAALVLPDNGLREIGRDNV